MNGIIYCRVSSKEQTEGTSLESQETACREYANAKEISISGIFIERGESAKFADRTALLELLDFVRAQKGKIQVLIVWKVDRFARNVGDHFNIKAMLLKYGVRIVSVTEPIDANPEGKLMETILAGFAQFDNDIRAMRTVQGMRKKIQEGIFPWKPPLGYQTPERATEKKTVPDEPNEPLFSLLTKAWREFATGAYTKAEIRRLMANWGVVTRRGAPLSAPTLDEFFRNRFYAGIVVDPWSGEEHPGKHRAMVSEADFLRVQAIVSKRNRSFPHQKIREEFPLRGLIRCSSCRRYLTASFTRHRYPYYHCGNRSCGKRGKTLPAGPLHDDFRAFLEEVSAKPVFLPPIREAILFVAEERQNLKKTRASRREAGLRGLGREADELIRMRAQGLITDEEFKRAKAALDGKRLSLLAQTDEDALSRERLQALLGEILQPLCELRATWKALSVLPRRQFQQLLLPVGFVNGDVGTAETGCIFRLREGFSTSTSHGVALVRQSWNSLMAEIREFAGILRSLSHPDSAENERVPTNAGDRPPERRNGTISIPLITG